MTTVSAAELLQEADPSAPFARTKDARDLALSATAQPAPSPEMPSVSEVAATTVAPLTQDEARATDEDGQVQVLAQRLRIEARARELVAHERATEVWVPPKPMGLGTLIADKPATPQFHIQGMWPFAGNLSLVGPNKWGKSTMVRHTTECCITGTPFLGMFPVTSPFTRALITDMELSEYQLWSYWKDSGLSDAQAEVWSLRGSARTMQIRDPYVRRELVQRLRDSGADLWVIDPFGPVLRANGWDENSNNDVGLALDLIDEMKADAGITAVLLPHHTGRLGEHGRGASVLEDKPDAIWTGSYVKPGDPFSGRCLAARGRDVSLSPRVLGWDAETHTPTLSETSPLKSEAAKTVRTEKKANEVEARIRQVVEALELQPDGYKSNTALKDHLGCKWDGKVLAGIRKRLIEEGLLRETDTGWYPRSGETRAGGG